MAQQGICIVGLGRFSRVHAKAFGKLRIPLYFSSRDIKRARKFAREYSGVSVGDYYSALRDARVGSVVLCSPHDQHKKQAIEALRCGKAVLLEKPLAGTLLEAKAIVRAVGTYRGRLMVAENYAYLPPLAPLVHLLKKGVIGRLIHVEAKSLLHGEPTSWRLNKRRMGGGILIDMGVHYIHLLLRLLGKPSRVRTRRRLFAIAAMQGESEIDIDLEFLKGVTARYTASWNREPGCKIHRLTVEGLQGQIHIDFASHKIILEKGGSRKEIPADYSDADGALALAKDFAAYARRGGKSPLSAQRALSDVEVVFAAYQSARNRGAWQRIKR